MDKFPDNPIPLPPIAANHPKNIERCSFLVQKLLDSPDRAGSIGQVILQTRFFANGLEYDLFGQGMLVEPVDSALGLNPELNYANAYVLGGFFAVAMARTIYGDSLVETTLKPAITASGRKYDNYLGNMYLKNDDEPVRDLMHAAAEQVIGDGYRALELQLDGYLPLLESVEDEFCQVDHQPAFYAGFGVTLASIEELTLDLTARQLTNACNLDDELRDLLA